MAPLTDQIETIVSAETNNPDRMGGQMPTENIKNTESYFKNEENENFTFLSSIDMPDKCTDGSYKLTMGDILQLGRERELNLQQGEGKPLFVMTETKVKGKRVNIPFELDTGSDRSIISRREFEKLGIKCEKFKEDRGIRGISGGRIECKDFCILNLGIKSRAGKRIKLNILCYIIDENIPNLLGSDILGYMAAKIDYENHTLNMDGMIIDLKTDRGSIREGGEQIFFASKSRVKVPAFGHRMVSVALTSLPPDKFALLGFENGKRQVLDVYCERREDNSYKIAVVNMTSKTMSLKKGEKLGFLLAESDSTHIVRVEELLAL